MIVSLVTVSMLQLGWLLPDFLLGNRMGSGSSYAMMVPSTDVSEIGKMRTAELDGIIVALDIYDYDYLELTDDVTVPVGDLRLMLPKGTPISNRFVYKQKNWQQQRLGYCTELISLMARSQLTFITGKPKKFNKQNSRACFVVANDKRSISSPFITWAEGSYSAPANFQTTKVRPGEKLRPTGVQLVWRNGQIRGGETNILVSFEQTGEPVLAGQGVYWWRNGVRNVTKYGTSFPEITNAAPYSLRNIFGIYDVKFLSTNKKDNTIKYVIERQGSPVKFIDFSQFTDVISMSAPP